MQKRFILLGLVLFFSGNLFAQSTQWAVDKAHSRIGFSVKHMLIATVRGQFDNFDLTVLSDKEDFSDSKVELSINVNSVNTQNERRDGHLRSPDFFAADSIPEMTFKSTGIEKVGENKYKITGDLTMKGVTKSVTLDGEYGGTVNTQRGARAGFYISGEINRFDFGVKWDRKLDTGSLVVSENVRIEADIELNKSES